MKTLTLLAILVLAGMQTNAAERPILGREEAWMLVMNTPDGIQLEARGGCPSVELIPEGEVLISAQLRNACPTSGNGMVNNYTIDLRTGQIWTGVDDRRYIDSERLRRLRQLLTKK